jgi:hypothetical protein
VPHVDVEDLGDVGVDAAEVQAHRGPLVEAAMQARQGGKSGLVDRSGDECNEVEVADAGRVVVRRQRPCDKQIADPA